MTYSMKWTKVNVGMLFVRSSLSNWNVIGEGEEMFQRALL